MSKLWLNWVFFKIKLPRFF